MALSSAKPASRDRTMPVNDSGTPAEASTSSTRNGTPSAARCTRATSSSSQSTAQARTISATSSSPRRPSGMCSAPRLPASRRASSDAADGGSLRLVATHKTRSLDKLSARYSTTARVSGSAQCRSSRVISSPPGTPSRRISRMTASPRATEEASPSCSPPIPGSTARSAGSHGASPASPGNGRSRRICSKESVSGRYGVPDSAGTALPLTANAPRRPAWRASSRTSRDLPIPGSPVTNTRAPLPPAEAARASSSKRSSSSRPTSTGHSATPTRSVCHAATSEGTDHSTANPTSLGRSPGRALVRPAAGP